MEGIRLIGYTICITIVVTAIFTMLVPNSKLEKVLKFAISLFFLTSIISPFVNNKVDFRIDMSDTINNSQTQNLSESIQNQFLSVSKKNIESSFEKILREKNISVKKIDVLININDDNSISINRLMVYIDKANEKFKSNIEKILKEQAGCVPQVVVG